MASIERHLAVRVAHAVYRPFIDYRRGFDAITSRARDRFEGRDWRALLRDSVARIDLYEKTVTEALAEVDGLLGDRLADRSIWHRARREYRTLIATRPDIEIAETYFNSVTRRVFDTVGVDAEIEFVTSEPIRAALPASDWLVRYDLPESTERLLRDVLRDRRFHASWWDLHGDIARAAEVIDAALRERGMSTPPDRVEVLDPTFFRGHGAYVVAQVRTGSTVLPLVIAIQHRRRGMSLGAVLTSEEDVSILFSYTRAAFVVRVPDPAAMVRFLRTLLPQRRVAELYSALGFGKHAKTELFRDLMSYIASSDDRFEYAPGMPGLVMIVFTLPGYDVVFKVIRDRFPPQKQTTPDEVRSKYRIVSRHDRAGRLIDAQEFEHLRFRVDRFDPDLLAELVTAASRNVTIEDDEVTINRAYIERRVTPLDVFLRTAGPEEARAAMVEYGTAIKNLAASNIFPGDLLIKNFGLTGRGRVVFYDYDELVLLTECNFRTMPVSDDPYDDMADTPWFGVGEHDVFPEEFRNFLGVAPDLRREFETAHGDIFDAGFWQRIQDRIGSGETIEIHPYSRNRALR